MGPRFFPPLEARDVRQILRNRNFAKVRQESSHETWEGTVRGERRLVTVDENCAPFCGDILRTMIRQSGLTREEFYGSSKRAAKKINCKVQLLSRDPEPEPESGT